MFSNNYLIRWILNVNKTRKQNIYEQFWNSFVDELHVAFTFVPVEFERFINSQ